MTHKPDRVRRGIAATEMALIAPVLLILLVGTWEVGRIIQIQNILHECAREGGRLAGSAGYFASDNKSNPLGGTFTLISPSSNTDYEVQKKMLVYLQAAGVSTTGATITIKNLGSATTAKSWSYTWSQTGTGTGSGYDPAAAADQLDQLEVTVKLPYRNVGWSPVNMFAGDSTILTATIQWASMRDVPLDISTTIPSQPLRPTDQLP